MLCCLCRPEKRKKEALSRVRVDLEYDDVLETDIDDDVIAINSLELLEDLLSLFERLCCWCG